MCVLPAYHRDVLGGRCETHTLNGFALDTDPERSPRWLLTSHGNLQLGSFSRFELSLKDQPKRLVDQTVSLKSNEGLSPLWGNGKCHRRLIENTAAPAVLVPWDQIPRIGTSGTGGAASRSGEHVPPEVPTCPAGIIVSVPERAGAAHGASRARGPACGLANSDPTGTTRGA